MNAYLFVYEFIAHALLDNVLAQCVPRSNMVGRGSSSQFATTLKIVQLPS